MTAGEIAHVRATLDFFAWAAEHRAEVEPVWEDVRDQLLLAATVATLRRDEGDPIEVETTFWNITRTIAHCCPVSVYLPALLLRG